MTTKTAAKRKAADAKVRDALAIPIPARKAAPVKSARTIDIKVGAVTVRVAKPSKDEVRRNVNAGQAALDRVQTKLAQPGITLKLAANVPLYHADPKNPDLLIRKLGKSTSSGRFVDGKFRAVATSRPAKKAAA